MKLYPVKEYFNLKYFAVGEPVGCVDECDKKMGDRRFTTATSRPPKTKKITGEVIFFIIFINVFLEKV